MAEPKKRLFPGGGRSTSFVFKVKVWRVGTSFLLSGQAEHFSSWLPLLLRFLGYHHSPEPRREPLAPRVMIPLLGNVSEL